MLETFSYTTTVSSSKNKDTLRFSMGKKRDLGKHFMVGKFKSLT